MAMAQLFGTLCRQVKVTHVVKRNFCPVTLIIQQRLC